MRALVVPMLLLTFRGPVGAHPLEPSLLEMHEDHDGHVTITWTTPLRRVPGIVMRPILPESCRQADVPTGREESERTVARWSVDCGGDGLVGGRVSVSDLADARSDVLVRIRLADGRLVQGVLNGDAPELTVTTRPSALRVVGDYVRLGVHHILTGWDHLLFVLGLLLLIDRRSLLVTLTAFTLAHSVTLSLAVLGVVHVPQRPVEVVIALSVFILAVELARDVSAPPSLLARRPWLMASGFGLLHGLGFAGALAQVGLPDGDIPLALGSFNVGIELGQLAVVVAALVVGAALQRIVPMHGRRWRRGLPAYAIGSLAAFWVLERTALLLG